MGKGKPSSVHATCGVGLPAAEHFSETAGPGCSVCSMKLYSRTGGASGVYVWMHAGVCGGEHTEGKVDTVITVNTACAIVGWLDADRASRLGLIAVWWVGGSALWSTRFANERALCAQL